MQTKIILTEKQREKRKIYQKRYRDKNRKPTRLVFGNQLIILNGETKSIKEWCLILDIDIRTIKNRTKKGMTVEMALKTPVPPKIFGRSKEERAELNRQKTRQYKKNYPDKVKNRRNSREYKDKENARYRERYKTDINFRIKQNMRRYFHKIIKRAKTKNSMSTMKLLGENWSKIKKYFEKQFKPGMTWSNYGPARSDILTWQIDHIKPCDLFDLNLDSEKYKCFHFTNLRPMWSNENARKNNIWFGGESHIDIVAQLDIDGNIIRNLDYNI